MIYESEYGTVDFWDPYPRLNEFKKIGINLSGGADSSLAFHSFVGLALCTPVIKLTCALDSRSVNSLHTINVTREESAPPDK